MACRIDVAFATAAGTHAGRTAVAGFRGHGAHGPMPRPPDARTPSKGEITTMANRNQGHNQDGSPRRGTSNRGFASMDAAQQREIARMGGAAVSGNREHMAQIGRKGGEASAESRANVRSAKARSGQEAERAPARDDQTTTTTLRSLGARSREDDIGQRSLGARGRDEDNGGRSLGASGAGGRNDEGRMLGLSNMDRAVERNLGGREADNGARNLASRSRGDDQGGNRGMSGRGRDADQDGNRGMSGRGRDADQDDNSASRGNRGNAVGSPRSNRDDD
jgi:hypothetical protein